MDIAKIEERIDKTASAAIEVSASMGGIRFTNMMEVLELAKMLAISKEAVPKHLRGEPGICLAVCMQAIEWRFSPYAVANKSYVVNERLAYESQLIHAIIEQRAPIKGRLRHRFEGEGDERVCIVWATPKHETDPLEHKSSPIGKITPKNSPLWKTKPDVQLYYVASRDWARIYFPDILLGVFAEDELRDAAPMQDVTPRPAVGERLKGAAGRGFSEQGVNKALTHEPAQTLEVPQVQTPEPVPATPVPEPAKGKRRRGAPPTAETPPPAQEPAPEPEAPAPEPQTETPFLRGQRLLKLVTTRADVKELEDSIAEELSGADMIQWHRDCEGWAGSLPE